MHFFRLLGKVECQRSAFFFFFSTKLSNGSNLLSIVLSLSMLTKEKKIDQILLSLDSN